MRIVVKGLSAGLLLIALAIGVGIGLSWAPDIPVDRLKAKWAPAPSAFIEVAGLSVHVRDEGSAQAPVVLLLHGTSASLHTWEGWAAALQDAYRVVSVDLPGFGLSDAFSDGDFSVAHYSAFLAELMAVLKIERAHVVGNSFGGQLAWQFALDQPDKVHSLTLIDASGYPRQSTSVPLGFRLASEPVLNRLTANFLPRALIKSSVQNVYGDPDKVTPALIDRYYELARRAGNRAALQQRFGQYEQGVEPARIRSISAPSLILWGALDGLIPPSHGRRFHTDIAGSQLVVFAHLGHVPQEEDPAATVAAFRAFTESLTPAP